MQINELANKCHKDASKLGWYDKGKVKSDAECMMMVVTEVAEAVEAMRGDEKPFYLSQGLKPEGVAVEVADAIIRLLDFTAFKDWDIEKIIMAKLEYNLTRGHRHGGKKL